MRTLLLLVLGIAVWGSSPLAARAADRYETILVNRFTIEKGVEFPMDYAATLQEELVSQLRKSKFKEVLREGEKPSRKARALRVDGAIIEFHAGSRAKRYLVGFGAGKTKIVAHVRFIDQESGNVLLEKNVDGKVIIGFVGGDSLGATRGLAKELKGLAAKSF